MESKKSRLVKGSPEAIEHMKMLRAKEEIKVDEHQQPQLVIVHQHQNKMK